MLRKILSKISNINIGKKGFLTWPEYAQLITAKERINFMNDTAKRSIRNYWNKQKIIGGIKNARNQQIS